jgi:hypothetical protein
MSLINSAIERVDRERLTKYPTTTNRKFSEKIDCIQII